MGKVSPFSLFIPEPDKLKRFFEERFSAYPLECDRCIEWKTPAFMAKYYDTGMISFYMTNKTTLEEVLEPLDRDGLLRWEYNWGCDEAGKGEVSGGLAVSCAKVDGLKTLRDLILLGVKDSKKLKRPKLIKIARHLLEWETQGKLMLRYRYVSAEEYNNLYDRFQNQCLLLRLLYADLISDIRETAARYFISPCRVLVDGKIFEGDVKVNEEDLQEDNVDRALLRGNLGKRFILKGKDDLKLVVESMPLGERVKAVATASIISKYLYMNGLYEELNEVIRELELKEKVHLPDLTSNLVVALLKTHPEMMRYKRRLLKVHFRVKELEGLDEMG